MRRLTTWVIVVALAVWLQTDATGVPGARPAPPLAQQTTPSEPLVIVVNRSNPVDKLSSLELRSIFLGSRSHWADGRRITLVMRDPGELERKTVLRDIYDMNESQFKTHFLHGLFTGEILVSPQILSTPVGVRKFIFNVPGAIGYLRLSNVDASVKMLRIDESMPVDKGYKLRVQDEADE